MNSNVLKFLLVIFCLQVTNSSPVHAEEWGEVIKGLQCRITLETMRVYKEGEEIRINVEFKNVSSEPIRLLDFQDKPTRWRDPAGYFRCMILGFNEEPIPYHLITAQIEKYVTLEPGEIYSFVQDYSGSVKLTAKTKLKRLKMIYAITEWVAEIWTGDYWKGRLESNEISIDIVGSIKNIQ